MARYVDKWYAFVWDDRTHEEDAMMQRVDVK